MTRDLLDCMVFDPSQFDMAELAYEVVRQAMEFQPVLVQLKFDSVPGYWRREALKRALENLLGNAIKYGAPGQPTSVDEIASIFQVCRRARGSKSGKQ